MKKYKLITTYLGIDEDTVFEETEKGYKAYLGCNNYIGLPKYIVENSDVFEEIEEAKMNKRWRANYGEVYHYVDSDGLNDCTYDIRNGVDDRRYMIGNYYENGTDAHEEAQKQNLVNQIRVYQREREGGKKGGIWTIAYNSTHDKFYIRPIEEGTFMFLSFNNDEVALDAIKEFGDRLYILLENTND